MAGVLRLNDLSVADNPAYGSHDPGMMWDPRSRRYYSYSTDCFLPKAGLKEKIGIPVRVSDDLVHFSYQGTVLSPAAIRQGRDNGAYPATKGFWAPYGEYVHGEYRLYYSATRDFGSSESRIWLAVSQDPLGPFENRGVVADTWGTDDSLPNAIDPHVLHAGEEDYLVYGSFFGGIYMKRLCPETGLAQNPDPHFLGKCVAHQMPPPALEGPEGPAAMYCPETGYYYLFLSYGWLGDGYDIRVGRAADPLGPYLDWHGRDLAGQTPGLKLAGSWIFRAKAPQVKKGNGWRWGGLRGPGHGVPFHDPVTGRYFFVHHIRDGNPGDCRYDPVYDRYSYRHHYMVVRPMFFVDGWPVLGPEPYNGESMEPAAPPDGEMWEVIVLDDRDNKMKTSGNARLAADGELLCRSVCCRCTDFENGGQTLAFTGIDQFGQACWGKLMK